MVSEDCSDLLRRLLVADPAQRLTMAQINVHPWFTTNLPGGMNVLAENDKIIQDTESCAGEDHSGNNTGTGNSLCVHNYTITNLRGSAPASIIVHTRIT